MQVLSRSSCRLHLPNATGERFALRSRKSAGVYHTLRQGLEQDPVNLTTQWTNRSHTPATIVQFEHQRTSALAPTSILL